ncbi:MAG: hypothetical protein Ta2A_02160 [Treponemataceae bacterium]|nr:MAG: hypothetical protein Ta2A_02160 [Treponemataceae bacterium]
MVFGEWDMSVALRVAKEEGWEEGREEGMEAGIEKGMEAGREEGMGSVLELLDEDQRKAIKQKLLQNSAYATSHR